MSLSQKFCGRISGSSGAFVDHSADLALVWGDFNGSRASSERRERVNLGPNALVYSYILLTSNIAFDTTLLVYLIALSSTNITYMKLPYHIRMD